MPDQGYFADLSTSFGDITKQDVEKHTARLTKAEHSIREEILTIQAKDIEQFLQQQSFLKFQQEFSESPSESSEHETIEEDEAWDIIAEGYETSTDPDGDFSEGTDLTTAFDTTYQATDIHKRSFVVSKRQKIYDVEIREDKEEWCVYVPAAAVIDRYDFNQALKNVPSKVWLGNFILKVANERQKHLLHIGEFLVQNIERHPEFMEDGLACLLEFTQENIAKELDVDLTTITRLKNARFFVTRVGEITLENILNNTKTGFALLVRKIIDREDPTKPLSDTEIAEKLPDSCKCTGRHIGNIRNELGIPGKHNRKKPRMAERA
ncbi:MAG: hypothetical protein IBX72_09810 [Nitrospirae bacterium]|nr:hypothetical protein [Nitrospirota bacterium]